MIEIRTIKGHRQVIAWKAINHTVCNHIRTSIKLKSYKNKISEKFVKWPNHQQMLIQHMLFFFSQCSLVLFLGKMKPNRRKRKRRRNIYYYICLQPWIKKERIWYLYYLSKDERPTLIWLSIIWEAWERSKRASVCVCVAVWLCNSFEVEVT